MEIAKKINRHFSDFLKDWNCKTYLLIGGYGSGKSYVCALKIIRKLLDEVRTCLVVREVYSTLRESCYSLFADICASLEIESEVTFTRSPLMITFKNGSKIIFRGLDSPQKLKSIYNVSLIWIEEASEIRYSAYKELVGRLRHPSLPLFLILSTNPVSRANWVFKHFFKNVDEETFYRQKILKVDNVYYHHSTALNNFFLPESYRESLRELKNYDADLFRVAYLGEFGGVGLRVLPQFKVATLKEVLAQVEKIPRQYRFNGCDFGFETSYDAVIRVAVDDAEKVMYIYDEYYANHETTAELASAMKKMLGRELVKCDSASPRDIETLRRYGLNARAAKKWNVGSRHARLDNLKKVKSFHKIICAMECEKSVEEMSELTFAKDRNGDVLEDKFNIDAHLMDACFYALDEYQIAPPKKFLSRKDFFGY